MQWVEEADRGDKLIPLNNGYKAYCDYTLPDGRIVSLWKHALTSLSLDGGNTYTVPWDSSTAMPRFGDSG